MFLFLVSISLFCFCCCVFWLRDVCFAVRQGVDFAVVFFFLFVVWCEGVDFFCQVSFLFSLFWSYMSVPHWWGQEAHVTVRFGAWAEHVCTTCS